MQIASQHAEAVGERSGIRMKEWLFLNRITLYSAHISPRHVESATAIKANFADARVSLGDRATMSARVTAHAIAIKLLNQVGIGLSNAHIEEVAEGGHNFILTNQRSSTCSTFYFVAALAT